MSYGIKFEGNESSTDLVPGYNKVKLVKAELNPQLILDWYNGPALKFTFESEGGSEIWLDVLAVDEASSAKYYQTNHSKLSRAHATVEAYIENSKAAVSSMVREVILPLVGDQIWANLAATFNEQTTFEQYCTGCISGLTAVPGWNARFGYLFLGYHKNKQYLAPPKLRYEVDRKPFWIMEDPDSIENPATFTKYLRREKWGKKQDAPAQQADDDDDDF